ncbi:MAG: hypothetical protein ACK5NF_03415 [Bacilli bacterium]
MLNNTTVKDSPYLFDNNFENGELVNGEILFKETIDEEFTFTDNGK